MHSLFCSLKAMRVPRGPPPPSVVRVQTHYALQARASIHGIEDHSAVVRSCASRPSVKQPGIASHWHRLLFAELCYNNAH